MILKKWAWVSTLFTDRLDQIMNSFRLKTQSLVCIIIFLSVGLCLECDAGSNSDRLDKKQIINGFLLQWSSHIQGYESYFARLKTEGDRNAVQHLMDMGRSAFAKNDHLFSSACFQICIDYISILPEQMRLPNGKNFFGLRKKAKVSGLMKK